ncbi:MAG: ferrous iron transporter B [Cyanothece sp. SIO2G6]|nr:ferrous iron transporter B [Cyanothece sp. SIO2G6]
MSQPITYPQPIETAIAQIEALLNHQHELALAQLYPLSPRSLALLLLQRDQDMWDHARRHEAEFAAIETVVTTTQQTLAEPVSVSIAQARHQFAQTLELEGLDSEQMVNQVWSDRLHHITVHPMTGFPILLAILYFGIYKFVGEFGAGTMVDAIESFFEANINPWVNGIVVAIVPWPVLQNLFANDYGIITLGLRYAIAIVLPVVSTYFLVFSFLEDSGYLPRLSLMLDQLFKAIGLSGRAVIPMVLGLGCDTMATMVTRTLETQRERILATFLLALVVPCAAQWGVILGLLAQRPAALALWASVILGIFFLVGGLASRIFPNDTSSFYMDIPPLRLPHLRNILTKTYMRMQWYFWEIIPLFIWASVFIWIGQLTGLFDWIIQRLEPMTTWLGLPTSTAPIFLYGFFRRDYGAAGLFDLQQGNSLTGNQLVVAAVVLTLFLPCIAQLQILIKEQGYKMAIAMVAFIIPFSFGVGILLNSVLNLLHIVV